MSSAYSQQKACERTLDEEGAGGERAEMGREVPQRQPAAGPEAARDDGETATEVLRDVAAEGAADNSATVADDGSDGRVVLGETLRVDEVSWVEILRAVRVEVEATAMHIMSALEQILTAPQKNIPHEQDSEDAANPVRANGTTGLADEDLRLLARADGRAGVSLGVLALREVRRLGHSETDERSHERESGGSYGQSDGEFSFCTAWEGQATRGAHRRIGSASWPERAC